MISFIVYGKPVAQPRMGERGGLKTTQYGGVYKEKYDPAAKKKESFRVKCLEIRPDRPFDCPIKVVIDFYFSRPKDHYRSVKKRPVLKDDAPVHYAVRKRNDIDNLAKFTLDALNGIFWLDDGIIVKGTFMKHYTEKLPYTEIKIIEL